MGLGVLKQLLGFALAENKTRSYYLTALLLFRGHYNLYVLNIDMTTHHMKLFAGFSHYENLPMQYTEIFSAVKIENFFGFFKIFFLFLLKT